MGGLASTPGVNEEIDFSLKDSPEVVAARKKARAEAAVRMDEMKKEFRGWFADFAKEDQPLDTRIGLLQQMQGQIVQERMLPIGITRDDVAKGCVAVKRNLGCIKDKVKKDPECKKFEKAILKLLSTIDKVNDRSLIVA